MPDDATYIVVGLVGSKVTAADTPPSFGPVLHQPAGGGPPSHAHVRARMSDAIDGRVQPAGPADGFARVHRRHRSGRVL